MKNKYLGKLKKLQPRGMQTTIMIAFSVISISIMLTLGIVLYMRFSALSRQEIIQTTEKMMEQTGETLEDYLVSMRQISDTVYYNVVKEGAFPDQERAIQSGMNLLYEANRVLLVDMDYSSISRMMNQINESNSGQYYYLCDSNGEIIYHPSQIQISDGIVEENNAEAAKYKDGVYDESLDGENRKVIVNAVSYTGWKLVGVIPYSTFTEGMLNIRYFIAMLMLLMAMMLVVINRVVSVRISSPILKLNESVKAYEAGEKPEIYIGGSLEIRHLGHSIQSSYEQIDSLMKKIVLEQNERRKSELDALQSQINPHFLYNTLESITWMIEGERNDDAAFMISQLAKLFRISLSKGNTVITIKDELQHAQSYMNIQKVRYKNTFSVTFDVDPEICSYCTVKLILQPILENAINYGVSGMDDCGEIRVKGRMEEGRVILSVEDNGIGMSEEQVRLLLTDSSRVHKHGSGVGLVNVNNRIQLLFGKEYGVIAESEPDEGTTISICIPAVPYTEENRKILEQGYGFGGEEMIDRENRGSSDEEQS